MSKRDQLPSLGHAISYFERGAMPPIKALVLFFESWYRLGRVPNKFDYGLLYRALKEILPAVTEWPKEPVIYWAGKDLNGTPIHQAYVDSYDKFKEYLEPFGPLFDAHDFIRAYEEGKGSEYMAMVASVEPAGRHGGAREGAGRPAKEQSGVDQGEVNQSANCALNKPKRKSGKSNADPEKVIARLKRDRTDEALPAETREKAGFLLAGIERGEVKPYKAAKAMGYVKPPDPAKIVEKQREKLEPEEQVRIWEQWGRSLPDDVINRLEIAKDAYLNLSDDEALTFIEWVNNQAWSSAA